MPKLVLHCDNSFIKKLTPIIIKYLGDDFEIMNINKKIDFTDSNGVYFFENLHDQITRENVIKLKVNFDSFRIGTAEENDTVVVQEECMALFQDDYRFLRSNGNNLQLLHVSKMFEEHLNNCCWFDGKRFSDDMLMNTTVGIKLKSYYDGCKFIFNSKDSISKLDFYFQTMLPILQEHVENSRI